MPKIYFLISAILLLAGCRNEKPVPVDFYYWKTNMAIGETEKEYFSGTGAQRLYLRFFDVDVQQGGEEPLAVVKPFDSKVLDAEYVPVVFITNRTFRNMAPDESAKLAQKVYELTGRIEAANGITPTDEIQIDCDWTVSTRDVYFQFLECLTMVSGRKITCTLRLHQIKDRDKTGIPPVAKGYLMCYATSDPTDRDTENSILDIRLLKSYTQNINSYALPFDVALPLYSWGVVTNHLDCIRLINGVSEADMDSAYFKEVSPHLYEVRKDYFFKGMYLSAGFKLKIEGISPQLLREARKYLSQKIQKDYRIVYYHLDESFLHRFSVNELR